MATRSSLELMLEAIQKLDNQCRDAPPALPCRPASKARLPPARRMFPIRVVVEEREEACDGSESSSMERLSLQGVEFHCVPNKTDISDNTIEILKIQKFFRGHKVRSNYYELKSGIITLQSVIRGWSTRRQFNSRRKDHILVPYSILLDLQRRIVRVEGDMVKKKEENCDLEQKIGQFQKKWETYEANMKSMEIAWQDELRYVQTTLASSKKSVASQNNQNRLEIVKKNGAIRSPQEELCDLEQRFEEWKKEYKTRLREVKTTIQKFEMQKSQKRWWEKISRE